MNVHVTRTVPITFKMVVDAYSKVKKGGKAVGIDGESWVEFDKDPQRNLYVIWNRLSSGSYHPSAVRETAIPKKDGKMRKLGIPTLRDRIAQCVVKDYLEKKIDQSFHQHSYGYRPLKSSKQAIEQVRKNCIEQDWVIDLDIAKFFDEIDHELLMRAVERMAEEKWVRMYVSRWLQMKIINKEGKEYDRQGKGTPQGGVIALRTHLQTLSFSGGYRLIGVSFDYIIKSITFMTNGKIAELGVGQTHQSYVYFAAKGQVPAADSRTVDAEIWSVTNPGLSLYPISKGDQREDGDTGKFCSVYCKTATYTDQADKETIRIQRAIDQQSGPYCAGRVFSKEGSCQKRRNKLRYHLPMTGCGSKSSRRFIIFLFRPTGQLFSLSKILMN